MCLMGTIRDGKLVFDEAPKLPDGTRVEVTPVEEPRGATAQDLLRFAGTLTDEEADHILRASEECRRIDPELWAPES